MSKFFNLHEELTKWTISNLFIVPKLKIGRERLTKNGFINSFLYVEDEELDYKDCIYLLFNPPNLEDFNFFLFEERQRDADIIDEKDYNELILVVYKLPLISKEDFDKLWNGSYSKLSPSFLEDIPSEIAYIDMFGGKKTTNSIQYRIVKKDDKLRKEWEDAFNVIMDSSQELWTKPSKEQETFKLSNHESSTKSLKTT